MKAAREEEERLREALAPAPEITSRRRGPFAQKSFYKEEDRRRYRPDINIYMRHDEAQNKRYTLLEETVFVLVSNCTQRVRVNSNVPLVFLAKFINFRNGFCEGEWSNYNLYTFAGERRVALLLT